MTDYVLQFGTGNPQSYTGLSPTFISFYSIANGATVAPPGITEMFAGSGQYIFSYASTLSIVFIADGGATLIGNDRYVSGSLDSGVTMSYIVDSIGSTASSFGTTSTDPGTLYGYLKRLQEWNEGDAVFNKNSGTWDVYSRGSSYLLAEKTLTNAASEATKS